MGYNLSVLIMQGSDQACGDCGNPLDILQLLLTVSRLSQWIHVKADDIPFIFNIEFWYGDLEVR